MLDCKTFSVYKHKKQNGFYFILLLGDESQTEHLMTKYFNQVTI